MASPTTNKGMTYPAHGGAVNSWDSPLNANFDQLDQNLGGMYNITVTSTATTATYASTVATLSSTVATATIPTSLAQNLYYYVAGTLTQNLAIAMPTVGSFYFFNNQTAGAFSVSVGPTGGSAVSVPQTFKMSVVTSSSGAVQGTDAVQARFNSRNGTPNGSVTGSAATANGGLTDAVYDFTNRQIFIPSVSGSSSWQPMLSRVMPEGYLTVKNDTDSPVVTANTASATTVYYTPFRGNWTVLSDGTTTYPYQFSRFTLTLTAGMAANNIYDIFMYANPTSGVISPVIGTGPTWTAGGGSVSAGSGARGSGAGSTALTRLNGYLVNTVQVTLTNGGNTYTCPASQGIYLGSIWIDGSAGQVTCHRSVGTSRKFGVWNYYNRVPIVLTMQDSTASWTYGTATYRASNGTSANKASAFCGVAEEQITAVFAQGTTRDVNVAQVFIAIGENSTTTATTNGLQGKYGMQGASDGATLFCNVSLAPKLGIWDFQSLEQASLDTVFLGAGFMQMTVSYMG